MTLDEVLGLRVAVGGLGAEGAAFVALAEARGIEPILIDDHPDQAGGRIGQSAKAARPVLLPGEVPWSEIDVVVRAPGVSRYRPEFATAEEAGVTVTTAMALWLEDYADAQVVAVTGTKGKSTTAALMAAVLEADGHTVELIGNIGVPVVATYGRPRADAYVVEVSSYQAADVTRSPGVVVLTSLAPDHLDWHGGVEPYYRDKLRLIEAGPPGLLAVSAGNPEAVQRTAGHPHRTLYGPEGRVRVGADGWIEVDGVRLVDTSLLRVPGRHNVWNLCGAVVGVLLLTGVTPSAEAVAAAMAGFAGLESRCRPIGDSDGRTYVDDALASNPFATVASIDTFAGRALTVIVGGADRGVDPAELVEALATRRPMPSVVVLPPGPDRLVALLADAGMRVGGGAGSGDGEATGEGSGDGEATGVGGGSVQAADDLAGAVAIAAELTPDGGVVLFSPGAPTPEGGGGYRERSRQFAEAAGLALPGS